VITGAAPPAGIEAVVLQVPRLSQTHPDPAAEPKAPPRSTVVVPAAAALPRLRTVALNTDVAPTTKRRQRRGQRDHGCRPVLAVVTMPSWLVLFEVSVPEALLTCAEAVRPNRPLARS